MTRAIGKTKSWLWWATGLVCALAFGSLAQAGELVRDVAKYGVRPRPPGPPAPVRPAASEAEKKQAGALVEEYLADPGAAEPGAEEKKEIARLIEDLGSDRFATREAASKALVKFGTKALPQLKEAQKKNGDAEVVQRAGLAVKEIGKGGRDEVVAKLRKVRSAAHLVIRERLARERAAAYKAKLSAIALEKAGRAEALRKARAEAEAAGRKAAKLGRLYNLVVYGAQPVRPVAKMMVRYGCRVKMR